MTVNDRQEPVAPTVTALCRALDRDSSPLSGWMRGVEGIIEPRIELFISSDALSFWVRVSGVWASGWAGSHHFHRRLGPINAWRLRRAIQRWDRRAALRSAR